MATAEQQNQESAVIRCLSCQTEGIPADTPVCPNCGANMPTLLRDTLSPGMVLNNGAYKIDYVLGRGGFGITYKGKQTALEQTVAIKEFYLGEFTQRETTTGRLMVLSDREEEFSRGLMRFEREGKTLAALSHPNVVRVLNLFNDNGTTYLVMEYLSGKTLKAVMKEGRLTEDRIRQIMESLVDALAAVHDKGVYHLDIKPANVLIEPSGRVVLIDFGAARQGFSSQTTIPAYTPSYAPIEVMSAEQVGPYSDIFELGMMLHEMLTGTLPPPALDRLTKMQKQGDWEPDPEKVSDLWRTLILSALPLRPEERPQDVHAWWDPVMGATSTYNYRPAGNAAATQDAPPPGAPVPGTDIHAEAEISPGVAKNGGEAAYVTENNERGTFRCPAGVWDGAVHRVPGQGNPGKNGGRPGALIIKVKVRQNAPRVGSGSSNSASGRRTALFPTSAPAAGGNVVVSNQQPSGGGMSGMVKIGIAVGVVVLLAVAAIVVMRGMAGAGTSGVGTPSGNEAPAASGAANTDKPAGGAKPANGKKSQG
ncbi:MAG: hypothetical protein OHK0029_34830 [Armatimonadaceae bacterium]